MSRTDEATGWAARMDAGPLAEEDRLRLDQWLAADPLNKGALLQAQAMLCLIYEAPDRPAPQVEEPAAEEAAEADDPPGRQRWWVAGLSGMAVAAAAVAAALALLLPGTTVGSVHSSQTGEVRRIALEDGSRAIINTASLIETTTDNRVRVVKLSQGEAWFNVAKDRERPFTVEAGPIRVMATGTAFAVRRDAQSATVTVTEGRVEIWNEAEPHRLIAANAGQSTTMPFAPRLFSTARLRSARESALAWRDGDIVLEEMPLKQAVDEFNRYNIRKIVIASSQIGAKTMVGYFRVNQPEQFAEAAAQLSGAHVVHRGNTIVIEQ
ncbi:FecR family protein [Croceibacterium ferulae]|uniref:FecR family protein n=1 Tax=Croceibacterium ferulae TaxID=1854641 RepID=UPI000EAFDCB0|nr:FecR domain-containing protein [Croceibacterium ferulae]